MIKAKKVAFIAVSVVIALLLAVGSLLCVPGVSSFVASGLGFKQPVYNGGATATLTVGDEYTVPAHQFEVGGTSYVADAIVISPSGKVTEKETFTLTLRAADEHGLSLFGRKSGRYAMDILVMAE